MRVLFVPLPWPTHYFAMVGLAWACRLRGDEVRIATERGAVDAVVRSGMVASPIGADFDFMAVLSRDSKGVKWKGPKEKITEELRATPVDRYRRLAESMTGDLLELGRKWRPDLVIWDPAVFAGPIVAQALGVPSVRHTWGPDVTRLLRWPGMGTDSPVPDDSPWPEELAELFDRYGAKQLDDLADLTLDTCPARLQVPGARNRVPLRYTPYNGPGVLPDWLLDEPERPRVCVTWGTASTDIMGDKGFAVPKILDALSVLDTEVVVTAKAGDLERIGRVPPNVRVTEQLPLNALLPSCRAIVHQGGSGTVMTAACYGVPQLAGGTLGDQEFNAARLAEVGSGIALPAAEAETGEIRDAVSRLLDDPEIRAAADRLRDNVFEHPPPAEIAERLRDLVRN